MLIRKKVVVEFVFHFMLVIFHWTQDKITLFIGITELRAVQEQLRNIENLKVEFAKRFYTHLDKFISQHVSD